MKILMTIPLLFFFSLNLFSQENSVKLTPRIEAKNIAREQIKNLRKGALLVRLNKKTRTIEKLRSDGFIARADQLTKEQLEFNQEVMKAFKASFSFCPVYFFQKDQSEILTAGDHEELSFLNSDLKTDSSIVLKESFFLVAEFGDIELDTSSHSGNSLSFDALVLKDDKLDQLKDPFPFYVRTFDSLPTKRKPEKAVKKLNRKLKEYLEKNI